MPIYGFPNTAQWRSISEPDELIMIVIGQDDHHEFYFAPVTNTLYRTLADTKSYWHRLDSEGTVTLFKYNVKGKGHFDLATGWVSYPDEDPTHG